MKAILTDGYEVFEEREVESLEELTKLNRQANEASDGNIVWQTEEPDENFD
jgi:hypothetical protein